MPTRKTLTRRPPAVVDELIERRIHLIRGQKVMLDSDLAELYGVPTKRLNERVKRNLKRFPKDFMIRLTDEEIESLRSQFATSNEEGETSRSQFAISNVEGESLRSQIVTSKTSRGGRRYAPYAFTEQGVAMLSSVLNSGRAIDVNIAIMRAFVRLREMLATHKDLARKLEEMEKKYDAQFKVVFQAIRQMMEPPAPPPRRRIGFRAGENE
ncbi:MAG: ORF6N domain-containing protein [Acidobacteria bacterium]|nr:ORF6N domain-containing protein [Acidobacteriota bacterium]